MKTSENNNKRTDANNVNSNGTSQSFVTAWGKDPAHYWERPDYVKGIAKTAIDQLICSGANSYGELFPSVLASWGLYNNIKQQPRINILRWRELPAVALHVNGFEHTGWVIISLNEGADLYEVELADEQFFAKPNSRKEDVYSDQLAELVDAMVETGGRSEAEYHARIEAQEPLLTAAINSGAKHVVIL